MLHCKKELCAACIARVEKAAELLVAVYPMFASSKFQRPDGSAVVLVFRAPDEIEKAMAFFVSVKT